MALPPLPNIKQLSPYVTRILGQNPGGFTLQGTNTYLVGAPSSNKRLLIDTGQGEPAYLELLREYLRSSQLEIAAIVLTHWHTDHIGGLADVLSLGEAPVYKFPSREKMELRYEPLQDLQVLEVAGVRLRVLHTPGHTDDHIVLAMENERALFAADNVLGHGTTSYTNYPAYMASLERMLGFPARIFPGHGEVVENGVEKIREYIAHRRAREEQVLNLVKASEEPLSAESITATLYAGVPPQVRSAALRGVEQFLAKLESEERVRALEAGPEAESPERAQVRWSACAHAPR